MSNVSLYYHWGQLGYIVSYCYFLSTIFNSVFYNNNNIAEYSSLFQAGHNIYCFVAREDAHLPRVMSFFERENIVLTCLQILAKHTAQQVSKRQQACAPPLYSFFYPCFIVSESNILLRATLTVFFALSFVLIETLRTKSAIGISYLVSILVSAQELSTRTGIDRSGKQ